jgi:hypothetical protein
MSPRRARLLASGLVLLTALLAACAAPGASSPTPAGTPNLALFVGVWARHGAALTIESDGRFNIQWRTYRTCGQDPPPCDQFVNNLITSGGQAIGSMHAVAARSAVGQVSASNDATVVPATSFVAGVTEYQLLTLRFPSTSLALCGKDFVRLAPPQVARTSPCGA